MNEFGTKLIIQAVLNPLETGRVESKCYRLNEYLCPPQSHMLKPNSQHLEVGPVG